LPWETEKEVEIKKQMSETEFDEIMKNSADLMNKINNKEEIK
jgi:hypothetical protein